MAKKKTIFKVKNKIGELTLDQKNLLINVLIGESWRQCSTDINIHSLE